MFCVVGHWDISTPLVPVGSRMGPLDKTALIDARLYRVLESLEAG